ncbi:MAG: Hsp20/alpha crystallin family protein [Phycisphaerales bacterium]|nr:Hsp20/alpha crystallin family protein [Phycisphaerales bacterium]
MAFNPFGKEIHLNMSDIQDEMNRMFQRLWSAGARVNPFSESDWIPYADVRDEADRVVVTAEVPGVDLGAVDVSFAEGLLTISGTKAEAAPPEGSGSKKLIGERRYGSFTRTLPIPHKVEPDKITATCKKGVLEIVLVKARSATARTIKIEGEP